MYISEENKTVNKYQSYYLVLFIPFYGKTHLAIIYCYNIAETLQGCMNVSTYYWKKNQFT